MGNGPVVSRHGGHGARSCAETTAPANANAATLLRSWQMFVVVRCLHDIIISRLRVAGLLAESDTQRAEWPCRNFGDLVRAYASHTPLTGALGSLFCAHRKIGT
jgi:hypothetical protein